ncbi:MAG: DUF1194 domain-containing protein [Pseudomonadota bacterium]
MARRLVALGLALALPVTAEASSCRLALALALDVSSSVDTFEYELQKEGLAAALTAPEVREAFFSAPGQTVALLIYEWSGRHQQMIRQDWVMVAEAADLDEIAGRVLQMPRTHANLPTAIGAAMAFGGRVLQAAPDCLERKLDVSGDGTNNDGLWPGDLRGNVILQDVIVNGLVIGHNRDVLQVYYEQFVIQGPGSFVELAENHSDFERAMRRKLVREVGVSALSSLEPFD